MVVWPLVVAVEVVQSGQILEILYLEVEPKEFANGLHMGFETEDKDNSVVWHKQLDG